MVTLNSVVRVYARNQILVLIFSLVSLSASAQVDYLALGDSLTAGLFSDGRGLRTCAAQGDIFVAIDNQRSCRGNGLANVGGWQPELSASLGQSVFNFGNTDETTIEILGRVIPTLNSREADTVLLMAGTNDVIRDVPISEIVFNLEATIANIKSRNREVVIATIPPLLGSSFAAKNAGVLLLNEEIRKFNDVIIADQYNALVSDWDSNNSGDFIHLGTLGNSVVAKTWLDAINGEGDKPINLVPIIDLLLQGQGGSDQ